MRRPNAPCRRFSASEPSSEATSTGVRWASSSPTASPRLPTSTNTGDFEYEPAAENVLGALLPRFVEMEIYHALLESIASEQSARMVAMRNATENARELIQHLTLMYNKARQEAITTELLDIAGGAAALQK